MYELIPAGAKSFYVQCPAKIGIYLTDAKEVFLIDSGNDKDAGKKVKKILEQQAWKLKGILNTHSHADHIGGNRYLQQQTGCKVFCEDMEAAFIRFPELEAAFLYGGYPSKDLQHKALLAPASQPVAFTDPDFPKEIEPLSLPGHSIAMTGFRLPDGTVFLGDCISSPQTLKKYGIVFLYDVEAQLRTLDFLEKIDGAFFVPAHAEASSDIRELIHLNRQNLYDTAGHICSICQEPISFELLLQRIFQEYELTMTIEQYALVGSTVRSYLSWLKNTGAVTTEIDQQLLLWKRV